MAENTEIESFFNRLDDGSYSGEWVDECGNKLTLKASPDHRLVEMSVNGEEMSPWYYEDEPEVSFSEFVNIWKADQAANNEAAKSIEVDLLDKSNLLNKCEITLAQILADHTAQSVMQEWSDSIEDLLKEIRE